MGAWGYGLFQSDADLDTMEEISDEAGKLAKDPEFTFWYPKNKEEVVGKLNGGLYHQLLQHFQGKKWDHGVVYMTALSMKLGVTIPGADLEVVRQTLERTTMYDEAKAQMQRGLEKYKNNGEEWNFESLGLHDTMASKTASDKHSGSKGFIGMNVFEDWSKQAKPMPGGPRDYGKTKPTQDQKKEEPKPKATGDDKLKKKGLLQAWFDS